MSRDLLLTIEGVESCSAEMKPYLRLWASVMRLGVSDYCTARANKAPTGDHRVVWFESNDYHQGSFTWLCDLFGLDYDKARSQVLMRWREHVDRRQVYKSKGNTNG